MVFVRVKFALSIRKVCHRKTEIEKWFSCRNLRILLLYGMHQKIGCGTIIRLERK